MGHISVRVLTKVFLFAFFSAPGILMAVDTHNGTAIDVTASLQVKVGGFRKDLRTGELVQAITVTNISRQHVSGDLYLVIDGLGPDIAVNGRAKTAKFGGATAKTVALRAQSGHSDGLKPGQQLTTVLRFSATDKPAVRYQARVLQQQINNK